MEFDQRDHLRFKSIKGSVFVGTILTGLGLATYFAIIKPLFIEPEKYKAIQEVTRKGIDQSKIQPGDMKVWTNPYVKVKDNDK